MLAFIALSKTGASFVLCSVPLKSTAALMTVYHRLSQMTMLLRLQEAAMCSSVYGGDGLEMTLGAWTTANQDESLIGNVETA